MTEQQQQIRRRSVEFRAADDAPEGVVRGYVTTFGNSYDIGYGWQERIERGAFAEQIRSGALPIMWQHDWDAGPIGVTRALTEDEHGVLAEAELFMDDPRGRAVWRAMQAGALREWSIGFYPEIIRSDAAEPNTDIIERGRLAEASVVVRGANPETTTLEVRAADSNQGVKPTLARVPEFLLDQLDQAHVRELVRGLAR
ncbi:hypothetical protein GCM10009760_25870 [Kitasatospora kazusensis]|uniref:Prohead serine protease domain-containing protein n=1 Tax=Kitasatospora kazusensis TaxID=407974 RepID=A0ABP5L471_9ACTN